MNNNTDDGQLMASEMAEALKASMSASKMTFDETQMQELVAALWDDAGLDSLYESMDLGMVSQITLACDQGTVHKLAHALFRLFDP